jgi:hypothetical protein
MALSLVWVLLRKGVGMRRIGPHRLVLLGVEAIKDLLPIIIESGCCIPSRHRPPATYDLLSFHRQPLTVVTTCFLAACHHKSPARGVATLFLMGERQLYVGRKREGLGERKGNKFSRYGLG